MVFTLNNNFGLSASHTQDRLIGLVVKASALSVADLGSIHAFGMDLFQVEFMPVT